MVHRRAVKIFLSTILLFSCVLCDCNQCLSQTSMGWCPSPGTRSIFQGQCAQTCTNNVFYNYMCPINDEPYFVPLPFNPDRVSCCPSGGAVLSSNTFSFDLPPLSFAVVNAQLMLTITTCREHIPQATIVVQLLQQMPQQKQQIFYTFSTVANILPCSLTNVNVLMQDTQNSNNYPGYLYRLPLNTVVTMIISVSNGLTPLKVELSQINLGVMMTYDVTPNFDMYNGFLPLSMGVSSTWPTGLTNYNERYTYYCVLKDSTSDQEDQCQVMMLDNATMCQCKANIAKRLPYMVQYSIIISDQYNVHIPSIEAPMYIFTRPDFISISPNSPPYADGGFGVTIMQDGFWNDKESDVNIRCLFFDIVGNKYISDWVFDSVNSSFITTSVPKTNNLLSSGDMCVTYATMMNGNMKTWGKTCDAKFTLLNSPMIWVFFGLGLAGGIILIAGSVFGFIKFRRWRRDKEFYMAIPEIEDFQEWMVKESEVKWGNLIGEGSFATVFHGKWDKMKLEIAIKEIKSKPSAEKRSEFIKEIGTMKKVKHPNIVTMLGIIVNPKHVCILTEFMARGSLSSIIRNRNIQIEEEHIRKMALDTCKGMAHLHQMNIMHRDLKCANLFVDVNWNVKVGDFGLSRAVADDKDDTMTSCGTPAWAAPEVMQHRKYSTKADVFSFAICLWEMTTGEKPYEGLPPYQIVIEVAVHGNRPELHEEISIDFVNIIEMCWQTSPDKRPTFKYLVEYFEMLQCPKPVHPTPCNYGEMMSGGSLQSLV